MDKYWEEVVIMTCNWKSMFAFRILNKTCLKICDHKFNIYHIKILKNIIDAWKLVVKRKPRVNSWCRKIIHPDERYII